MRTLTLACGAACAVGLIAPLASAQTVNVVGGQTNVLLDTAALSAAASLDLSGVAGPVIAPGNLGPDSVAFPISGGTTFSYDPADFLSSFSGEIAHEGSVLFNMDTVEVGNFTIGFDAARAGTLGGNASGFFVESTVGIAAILFDVENPSALNATATNLDIEANLLVSPEFGAFLFDNGLSTANLEGVDVGDAFVQAVVPSPGVGALGLLACGFAARRRRG